MTFSVNLCNFFVCDYVSYENFCEKKYEIIFGKGFSPYCVFSIPTPGCIKLIFFREFVIVYATKPEITRGFTNEV